MSARGYELQRIRVDAQGYDATGAYWGAGLDVFIASSPDRHDEITVRARTVAEVERPPGTPPTADKLGGRPPRKTRYELAWTDPASRRPIRIAITHERDYLATGSDHIEIRSINPAKAPLPVTDTGYKSHFLPALELINAGGPVTFVAAWLEAAARSKVWRRAVDAKAQGDLFQWAEASAETVRRKPVEAGRPKAEASRPKAKPARTASRAKPRPK